MVIDRLELHGFTSLSHVALDLKALPSGLVAIIGGNGEGKSTLLESLGVAPIYREFPSRDGHLEDYATGRDSFMAVDMTIAGRGVYSMRVNVDGVKRNSDAVAKFVSENATVAFTSDGKVSTYDAYVKQTLPSRDMLLASAFAAQNKHGNFLSMDTKDQKALIGELIGLGEYERMHKAVKLVIAVINQSRDRLLVLRNEISKTASTEAEAETKSELALNVAHVEGVGKELGRIDAEVQALENRRAMMQDAVAAYATATQRLASLKTELARRSRDNGTLEGEIRSANTAFATEKSRIEAKVRDDSTRVVESRGKELRAIDAKLEGNRKILGMGESIRNAVDALAQVEAGIASANEQLRSANVAAGRIARERLTTTERLGALRNQQNLLSRAREDAQTLDVVPCGGKDKYQGCHFLVRATEAKRGIEAAERLVADIPTTTATLAGLDEEARAVALSTDTLAEQLKELSDHRTKCLDLTRYAIPLASAETRLEELTVAKDKLTRDAKDRLATIKADAQDAIVHLDGRQAEAERAFTLRAVALSEELQRVSTAVQQAEADLTVSADKNREAMAVEAVLASARATHGQLSRQLGSLEQAEKQLAASLADIRRGLKRVALVDGRLSTLALELVDWVHLEKALGPNGLPILELDAALPALSQLMNELLAVCFGPRFSVELVTQQAKADGKGMKESFDLLVTDNLRGAAPREVGDLSGGEQVIVSEAMMNALGLYLNSRSPMPIRTAWRDETTGALDQENAVRYFAMLRKVHEMGGYEKIYFVSHNPQITAMADAQIRVANGTATTALPPFSFDETAQEPLSTAGG